MTSAQLPTNTGYGTVTGRFLLAVADGTDPDEDPDGVPPEGLTLTFEAAPAYLLNVDATPDPVTIYPAPVVCTLDDQGYLINKQGTRGVRLIATDDPDLNPVNWTWKCTLRGAGLPARAFSFELPEDSTTDITLVQKVDGTLGEIIVRGPKGDAATFEIIDTVTGDPGTDATATNTGTTKDAKYILTVPRGDPGLNWRDDVNGGSWDIATTYEPYDAVIRNGSSYRALVTTTGNDPETSPTQWRMLASAGAGNVTSVNTKTGDVVLDATDVGALPDDTTVTDIGGLAVLDAVGVINHGTDGTMARSELGLAVWRGPAEPQNPNESDLWVGY